MPVKPEELKVGQVVLVQQFFAHPASYMRIDALERSWKAQPPFCATGVIVTKNGKRNGHYPGVSRTISFASILSIVKQPEEVKP